MRRGRAPILVLLALAAVTLPAQAAAAVAVGANIHELREIVAGPAVGATSSNELLSDLRGFDGKDIVYAGEVVGDVMIRGDRAWINVHDGDSAVGVFLPAGEARKVTSAGDYLHRGDIVRVVGRFARACAEHDGEVDIHATSLEIIAGARPLNHPVDGDRVALAGALVALALALYAYNRPHLVRRVTEALARTRPGV